MPQLTENRRNEFGLATLRHLLTRTRLSISPALLNGARSIAKKIDKPQAEVVSFVKESAVWVLEVQLAESAYKLSPKDYFVENRWGDLPYLLLCDKLYQEGLRLGGADFSRNIGSMMADLGIKDEEAPEFVEFVKSVVDRVRDRSFEKTPSASRVRHGKSPRSRVRHA